MTRILLIVTVVSVLLGAWLAYSNFKYAGKLAEARAEAQSYSKEAKAASAASGLALVAAAEDSARADKAEQAAQAHAARARALQAQLAMAKTAATPDTAAIIAQALDERDLAVQAGEAWMNAFVEQEKATASLQSANHKLTVALESERAASGKLQGATDKLVKASKRSFWDRFAPKLSINATVGVDPLHPEQGIKKVVGIGGSWSL